MSGVTNPVVFSGTIAPTAITAPYRLGLALVTIAMILVPLLYLSLVAAVAWFLVWHLTTNIDILDGGSGGQFRLLAYLTPGVVGATLLFFMVKPILATPARRSDPVRITETEQPLLHALIRDVCRQVRAPLPSRVQVDCQVNASAALRGGLFGRDLDLTIGLPLVTGLSVRELTGVLAHEFGHFAQGGGMRMTALIRGINAWLFRVVHERDSWDAKLEAWSEKGDWRVMIPMALARLCVWIARKALAVTTAVGHAVSCYMLRQMEFDADSYEIKIAGTDAFTRTAVRLRALAVGSQLAYSQLRHAFDEGAIAADFPLLVAECSRRLPDEVREKLHRAARRKTGRFDTHPSDGDRVAAAQRLAAPGTLLGGDEPATKLFRKFEGLSAAATRHHYEQNMGIALNRVRLLTVDDTLRSADSHQRAQSALQAFFRGRVSVTRPLRIPVESVAAGELGDLDRALSDARAAVIASSASEKSYRQFEQYQTGLDLAFCAEQLLRAGHRGFDPEPFQLEKPSLAEAQSVQSWALREQDKLRPELDEFDTLMARRIALGVLIRDRGQGSHGGCALAAALNTLADALPYAVRARRSVMAMGYLTAYAPVLPMRNEFPERMDALESEVDECRAGSFDIFSEAAVPDGELSDLWRQLLEAATQLSPSDFLNRLTGLYDACLMVVARAAIEAEASTPISTGVPKPTAADASG